jgi:uncharacterized protein with PIN domain
MQREEEARIQGQKARDIASRLVAGQFSAGSQLAELAGVDPQMALTTAQALNIPIDQPARLKRFAEQVQAARGLAKTDPRGAVRMVLQFRDDLNLQGIETPRINEFLGEVATNPQMAFQNLEQIGQHFENIGLVEESAETKRAREREAEDRAFMREKSLLRMKGKQARTLEFQKQLAERAKEKRKAAAEEGKPKIGETDILEDGTVVAVVNGKPQVTDVTGKVLTGPEAQEKVLEARRLKIVNAVETAGGKREAALLAELDLSAKVQAGIENAKNAAQASVKAFDELGKVRKNMANLDMAIEAIDNGANTGFIQQFLPSIRTASVELKNVRNRLGLDVIGDVTFGALSEGELKLALDTAIPTGLDEPELRDWLVKKKNAQEVLSDYLHAAGVFLGTAGNTQAMWQEKNTNAGMGYLNGLRNQLPAEANEGDQADFPDEGVSFIFSGGRWRLVQ